jgi:hypothetical protein
MSLLEIAGGLLRQSPSEAPSDSNDSGVKPEPVGLVFCGLGGRIPSTVAPVPRHLVRRSRYERRYQSRVVASLRRHAQELGYTLVKEDLPAASSPA